MQANIFSRAGNFKTVSYIGEIILVQKPWLINSFFGRIGPVHSIVILACDSNPTPSQVKENLKKANLLAQGFFLSLSKESRE